MKKIMLPFACLLLILGSQAWARPAEMAAYVVKAKSPHIQAVRMDKHVTKVTMNLVNKGRFSHRVVAAYSPVANQVQLHKTVRRGNRYRMEPVRQIKIQAHRRQKLRANGFHVMLYGMKTPLAARIPVTLIFADGSHLTVRAPVTKKRFLSH